MRPGTALTLALVSAALPGCFTADAERTASLCGMKRLFSGLTGDDVVALSVAVVERPIGDRALNQDLWELVDEGVLDSDRRALLGRNGFRVGGVGGSPPPALYALICSDQSCCDNPRRIQLRSGNAHSVPLGPVQATCVFHVDQDGRKSAVDLAQARCHLRVVPKLAQGGAVTLHFTPFIKHGDLKQKPVAVRTAGGELQWSLQFGQDEECYPGLAWEMTVGANDTVVIGTRPDAANTLGLRTFMQSETAAPVQRLLVLRVGRVLGDPRAKVDAEGDDVPLAIQAGLAE